MSLNVRYRIRHYDARMVISFTWDEDGITECAFVTRALYRGRAVDQLQMHLRGGLERYGLVSNDSETYAFAEVARVAQPNRLRDVFGCARRRIASGKDCLVMSASIWTGTSNKAGGSELATPLMYVRLGSTSVK